MKMHARIELAFVATALAVAGAIGLSTSASAGSGWIVCDSGNRAITNGNNSASSWSTTKPDGTCGNVGMRAKTYVGGGAYGWTTTVYYGVISVERTRTYNATMTQSQHYWTFNGNATSKLLAE